jgi:pimeloyl-ACP methyl ester carboxylesterase
MKVIEAGHGEPLVLIPGLQGRWEYMRPAVDALATSWRVVTFDLCDEPSAEAPYAAKDGLDNFIAQVEAVLDHLQLSRAVICGISFGGLIALRFAARYPGRAAALVLASTPGPAWHLKQRHEIYARWPRVFGPLFLAETPWRLRAELAAAFPRANDRRRFAVLQLRTLVAAPVSLPRMAARARLISGGDRLAECAAVECATLVVHGEPGLDHVVDAVGTSAYVELIHGAERGVIPRTGHLGTITRPGEFAALLARFAARIGALHQQNGRHSAA